MNEDLKKYMEENKKVFLAEMSKVHKRLDEIEAKITEFKKDSAFIQ